jgi:hypothetical protein
MPISVNQNPTRENGIRHVLKNISHLLKFYIQNSEEWGLLGCYTVWLL